MITTNDILGARKAVLGYQERCEDDRHACLGADTQR